MHMRIHVMHSEVLDGLVGGRPAAETGARDMITIKRYVTLDNNGMAYNI